MSDQLCECGRGPKVRPLGRLTIPDFGCAECNQLDGVGSMQQDVISLLREIGEAHVSTVAFELGVARDAAWQALYRLERRGRVARRQHQHRLKVGRIAHTCWRLV